MDLQLEVVAPAIVLLAEYHGHSKVEEAMKALTSVPGSLRGALSVGGTERLLWVGVSMGDSQEVPRLHFERQPKHLCIQREAAPPAA